jgi:choline-sulfatase
MAGAGLPKNIKISTPVAHIDVVATMLELAGSGAYNKLRGHSLIPVLQDNSSGQQRFAFSESHSEGNCTGSFMIRKGDWKYIHFTWYDDLLFNVALDPGEFNNLIDKPETIEIQAELKKILYSQVNPEEVTLKAFQAQEKMLADLSERMTEDQLFEIFEGRFGAGQARALAKKCKKV